MKSIFQKWLFLFVLAAYAVTWGATFFLQTKQAEYAAAELIRLRISDAKTEVARSSGNLERIKLENRVDAIAKARSFAEIVRDNPKASTDRNELLRLLKVLNVDELDVINGRGMIVCSTVKEYISYDMGGAKQSAEFLELLSDPDKEIVQDPVPIGFDSSVEMQYAGVARKDAPGFVQIGYKPTRLHRAIDMADISNTVVKFRIGRSGGILLIKGGIVTASEPPVYVGRNPFELGITDEELSSGKLFDAVMDAKKYKCCAEKFNDFLIVGYVSNDEIYAGRHTQMMTFTLCLLFIFVCIFFLISKLVQNVVIKGIDDINASLDRITGGDLDELVQVMTNKEFVSLSCGINSMVKALKQAIAEAKGRIDAELQVAKNIQHSALPEADRFARNGCDFELNAEMFTAKEVGGDFYDFFFADDDHLVFVVADVSGKGIPAALFMMKCKTLINSIAETEHSPAAILEEANNRLCENNDTEMFVTVWLGIFEISTGTLRFANAGHNLPLLGRADGSFEYLSGTSGLVLAGMDGMKYKEFETKLDLGDAIFLYTDGVTEAIDGDENAYGDERLKDVLNGCSDRMPKALTEHVLDDLKLFTKGEPQFDDVTLLAMRPLNHPMKEFKTSASLESHGAVMSFVEGALSELGCPAQTITEIDIAVDEIFANIANYSGASGAILSCGVKDMTAVVSFSDDGAPYDPLQNKDPSIDLDAEEREIGGLGIYIVKKIMDDIKYEYRNGRNNLTIKKKFTESGEVI